MKGTLINAMKTGVLAAVICATLGNYATAQVDLNAPVATTPTVGSEIKRGVMAALDCPLHADGHFAYNHCVFDVESRNRQKVVDPDPFDVGLFFGAWKQLDILVKVDQEHGTQDANLYELTRSHYSTFHQLGQKVHVTDAQILSASGLNPVSVEPRLEYWSKQPPKR